MTITDGLTSNPIAALRGLARPRAAGERCELCSMPLAEEHQHLLEPVKRQLLCACDACAILFSDQQAAKFRRVPRRIEWWREFQMEDLQWEALGIPIGLAFFFQSSSAGQLAAVYPSPAGPTECLLQHESWNALCGQNPVLRELKPDVEALLVNRLSGAREYFRAPIDQCYKLVGLVRMHWRGFSGGTQAWERIGEYFADLKARASGGGRDA